MTKVSIIPLFRNEFRKSCYFFGFNSEKVVFFPFKLKEFIYLLRKIQRMKRVFGILLRFVFNSFIGLENRFGCVSVEFTTPPPYIIDNQLFIN